MGISHSDATGLSYWEYTAMLAKWNERRAMEREGSAPVDAPDPERVRRNHERLRNSPLTQPRVH